MGLLSRILGRRKIKTEVKTLMDIADLRRFYVPQGVLIKGPDEVVYRTGEYKIDTHYDEDCLWLSPVEVPEGVEPVPYICWLDFEKYEVLEESH